VLSVRSEDLVLLDRPHFVDYSFKNALYCLRRQRAGVMIQNVREYFVLTFGLINRKTKLLLYAANLLDDFRPSIEEIQKLNIKLIDGIATPGQILELHD
jgi:hypothetical protein